MNTRKKENLGIYLISLVTLSLAMAGFPQAQAANVLTKVGNNHAIWNNVGQVQVLNGPDCVVGATEFDGARLSLARRTKAPDNQTVVWKGAQGEEQQLQVTTTEASLTWSPNGRKTTISVFVPERAFGGTAAWVYTLTDQSGKVTNSRLSSDWNWPEPEKQNVAVMTVDTPAGSFTFSCQGEGWRFIDARPSKEHRGSFVFTVTTSKPVGWSVQYESGRSACFRTVDLSAACNRTLRDDVAEDQRGGWSDEGAKDLRRLPHGLNYFEGIPFFVIDDKEGKQPACIVLKGGKRPYLPQEKTVTLSGQAKMFYFLNALVVGFTWYDPVDQPAKYTVTYTDGTQASLDLVNGKHIAEWFEPKVLPLAIPGWRDPDDASLGLYLTFWENPFPQKALKSITFRSRQLPAVGIVAMTVSDLAVYPKPFALATKDQFPLPTLSVVLFDGPSRRGDIMLNRVREAKIDVRVGDFKTLGKGTDVTVIAGKLDAAQCKALKDYLEAGGSAFFITETPPQTELKDVLPIEVDNTTLYDCSNDLSLFVPVNKNLPMFSGIPWDRPLDTYPINPPYKYYRTTPKPGAEVLARWNGKFPALISGSVGKGRVLVWTDHMAGLEMRHGFFSSHLDYLFAKMLFCLSGQEKIANEFSVLAHAKQRRQGLMEPIARLKIAYENFNAVVGYLEEKSLSTQLADWKRRFDAVRPTLISGDDLIVEFKPREAQAVYTQLKQTLASLETQFTSLQQKANEAMKANDNIQPASVASGPPVEIGMTHLDYRYPPFGPQTVETWSLRRQIAAIQQLDWTHFDTVMNFGDMTVFLRPNADPAHPSPDHFDFTKFYDPLVEVCRQTGMKAVSHRAATYWDPAGGVGDYMIRGIPLMRTADGAEVSQPLFGKQANFFSDEARQRIDAFWNAHAMYVQKHPEFIAVEMDNEMPLYHPYCELAKKKWSQWLQERFKTVDNMNKTLGTSCRTFQDLPPVKDALDRDYGESSIGHATWYEFHKFMIATLEYFFQSNYNAHHKYSTKPVIDRSSCYGTQRCATMEMAGRTHDYVGPHMDKKIQLDLMIGATDKPFWLDEYYYSYWGGAYGGFKYRLFGNWILPDVEIQEKNFAAFGRNLWYALSRGVTRYSVYTNVGGFSQMSFDQGWMGPCSLWWTDMEPTFDSMSLKYACKEYNRISGELVGTKPKFDLCILEPLASVMQSDSFRSPRGGMVIDEMEHIRRMCYFNGYQPDVPNQKYDFSRYPVVIVPIAYYMEKELVDRLMDYVRQGGTLIATGAPNVYDEYSHPSLTLLTTLGGIKTAIRTQGDGILTTASGATLRTPVGAKSCWKFTPGENAAIKVLGTYSDKSVAAFTVEAGKGRLVVIGFEAGQALDTFWTLVKPYFEQAIVKPFENSNPTIIDTYHRTKGDDSFLFVMNQDHESPRNVGIVWKTKCPVVDLRSGVQLAPRNKVDLQLQPGECRVLKIVGYEKH
ncbi:MAG: beta-galactosidase trimerization domain-containing protein [Phycisphaerae bacterium]